MRKTGTSLNDVVRTRMFVTNVDDWPGVTKAHSEYFGDIVSAASMIEISRLMTPDFLIEMEVEAIIDGI